VCGRATLSTPPEELREAFGLTETPELFEARYNIAPTQPIAVVRQHPQRLERKIHFLRWGLVPYWANDPKIGAKMINARVESISSKQVFRDAFARRRCLIAVDGFYEWQARAKTKTKQPFFVHRRDGAPFALAGLWARWKSKDGEVLDTCTILTAPAVAPCDALHDRMPIIVAPKDYDRWLDPKLEERLPLLDIRLLHQMMRRGPIRVAIEERAADAAVQHAREREVMRLGRPLRHDLVPAVRDKAPDA
jgi:putative SOS response-associated peptidase YedK